MRNINWKTIAEFVGIAAIVASLIFVGMQLRQEQAIAIVDTYGSIVESNAAVLSLIADQPEVWEKGLLGEKLSTSDEIVFSGMVRAVFSHHAHMYIRFIRIGPGDPDEIMRDFAYAIYIFPGLRRQWEADYEFQDHRDTVLKRSPSILDFRFGTSQHLSDLDKLQPGIPDRRQFIFWYF